MKIIIKIIPHFTFILSIMIIVFLILDKFNPVMQFIDNNITTCLLYALAGLSLIESIYLIVTNTKSKGAKKNVQPKDNK